MANKDRADGAFDRTLNNYLTSNKVQGVFVSTRDDKCYVIGEQNVVTLIKTNPNVSIKEIIEKMKDMETNQDDDSKIIVDIWRGHNCFPLIPVDPNSKLFSSSIARSYLRKCLNILGYDLHSFKKYGMENHEPEGWPIELSWTSFRGPNHAKISEVKLICKALFQKHMDGINFENYYKGFQPPLPPVQNDLNDDHVEEEDSDENEVDRQDAGQEEQEHPEIEDMDSEIADSELDRLYQQMSDDEILEEEEEIINSELDDETNSGPQTPIVPANSGDTTVHFDRSAQKKRALNILNKSSGSVTDNDGSTFIENDEEVSPYMQVRLNAIAEREAAMKKAEEQGLF